MVELLDTGLAALRSEPQFRCGIKPEYQCFAAAGKANMRHRLNQLVNAHCNDEDMISAWACDDSIQAIAIHAGLNVFYVVHQDDRQIMTIAGIPFSHDAALLMCAQYPAMSFVSMAITGDKLLLQAHDRTGQLRWMQFGLPHLALEELAYQAAASR
ncbi:hypothetical protein IQ266_21940 [filamentous cyanobacterium LEGE 11480]|uniref:Uncharacterized protein n=1 Tax=Romeriopsis navalis LEGE 11480 TaxID=2777977 RepID=A0A928Z539_9CYAN|nr:hypothetical protein [Romeriopsis navalis]MBE9032404.1 hypothetical protein [Romeriopsis navalis LEGE 11480]